MLEIAIEAARLAGKIQRERFGDTHDVRMKGTVDLVTEVDLACEEAMRELFARRTPNAALLGEEGGEASGNNTKGRWIFDPLDGTTNYAHRVPHFCASVAYEEQGQIVAGALYDPIKDELFTAEEGGGATLNATPIRVSAESDLREALLATGFPYDRATNPRDIFGAFETLTRAGRGIRRLGSAALDLAYVAAGRYGGFWEIGLKPWDLSAGALLVSEAGGVVTSMAEPFDHMLPDIVASNGKLHAELTRALLSHLQ